MKRKYYKFLYFFFNLTFLSIIGMYLTQSAVAQESQPYPASPVIVDVTFDWGTHKSLAPGSDNWPITWADDDHQYTSWGDGGGFGGTNSDGRVSLGVARIEGGWDNYTGHNVWGGKNPENPAQFEGKSYGIISVDGSLYMWLRQVDGTHAKLAKSTNHGKTWTKANWDFAPSLNLISGTFLNFGRDYAGARDNYVYSYFIHANSNNFKVFKPGQIDLARVPKDKIMEKVAYQFFAGLDGTGNPIWTNDLNQRKPVFQDANGVGWTVSVSYNAGLGRYLLMTEHTQSFGGNLGIFDAPEPWGPWTTVKYYSNWGNITNHFFWNFSNKWLSEDGKNFTMVFTAKDSWNSIRGAFITADNPPTPTPNTPTPTPNTPTPTPNTPTPTPNTPTPTPNTPMPTPNTPTPIPGPNSITLTLDGPTSVAPGQRVDLSVTAHDVPGNGLYGVQLEITFDPTLVSASNLQTNPDLSFVVRKNINNSGGKIIFAASRQGDVPGLTGDVTLLTFRAIAADKSGTVEFKFANVMISDKQAVAIETIANGHTLSIGDAPVPATSTPTPDNTPTSIPNTPTPAPPTPTPNTPTPAPDTPTPTPDTPEPTIGDISGQIILFGRPEDNWANATLTINDGEQSASTDPAGRFLITSVPVESLTSVTADASGYLPAVCSNPAVEPPEITLSAVTLLAGDLNDDNVVDVADATTVGISFGQIGSGLPADVNQDNVINIFDIVLATVNYEKTTQIWSCDGGS